MSAIQTQGASLQTDPSDNSPINTGPIVMTQSALLILEEKGKKVAMSFRHVSSTQAGLPVSRGHLELLGHTGLLWTAVAGVCVCIFFGARTVMAYSILNLSPLDTTLQQPPGSGEGPTPEVVTGCYRGYRCGRLSPASCAERLHVMGSENPELGVVTGRTEKPDDPP